MLISAVIPTKNRAEQLEQAVLSVCQQSRRPDELLIIDQSPGDESLRRVHALCAANNCSQILLYVHDPLIAGLVAAKQAAVSRARGEIVCFLEDDIILQRDYLLNIERGFVENPEMKGCCGVVTNPPDLSPHYQRLFHLFHRGIFYDGRVGVYGAHQSQQSLIASHYISGGLSAYRTEVFAAIPFDVANKFFMLEDVDFSTRAVQHFGERFFINPSARLEHRMSPVNRAVLGARQRRKLREFLVFYKKRRGGAGASAALCWLLMGLLLEAGYQSLRAKQVAPLSGYLLGLWDGMRWKVVS